MLTSIRRRALLTALAFAIATPALAQAPTPAAPAAPAVAAPVRVVLTTTAGAIVVEVFTAQAPITAANFLRYVDQKRFDGTSFYRASSAVPGQPNQGGFIQGGVNGDPVRQLKAIAHESTEKTGLRHTDGTLSMGRFEPGTAKGDFFIVLGDQTSFDADTKVTPPYEGFAAFARVVEGMDVVKAIHAMPVSAEGGTGVMKGEMLAAPVKLITARRVAVPAAAQP